jgi:C4-dicarboxylate-specific signal transduction histidine kinase
LEFNFRRTNGKIVIELSDNGGGIDPAIIDRIFEPYFSTKGPDRGTGLGLYMSKVIIEHMAGSLSAGNSEEGAMFTLMLPAVVVPERRSSAFPR